MKPLVWFGGCFAAAIVLLSPGVVGAQGEGAAQEPEKRERRYTTREEQRDEAPKHPLTDWLEVSGLIEAEYISQRLAAMEPLPEADDVPEDPPPPSQASIPRLRQSHKDDSGRSFEAVFEIASPIPSISGELVWEYDAKTNRDKLDEAIVAWKAGNFELELGRLYAPFGEYFSHFVTGPALEFGETRGTGAVFSYAPNDQLDVSAIVFKGHAQRTGSSGSSADWGLAMEASPFETVTVGLSYFSDLAESEEALLLDNDNRYRRKVAGFSSYVSLSYEDFELTAERVQALDSFRELDSDRNAPRAWNLEVAFYPQDNFGVALRREGSQDLEDAPRRQVGAAIIWRAWGNVFVLFEVLRGKFEPGLAEDARERDLDRVQQVGAQISIDL